MNIWERTRQYKLDYIQAMIEYAKSKSYDINSKEYEDALLEWAKIKSDNYRKNWIEEHGEIELYTCNLI